MYAATFGCMYVPFGCKYMERLGAKYAVVECMYMESFATFKKTWSDLCHVE